MIIVAIDPGKTIGLAAWDTDTGDMRFWQTEDQKDMVHAILGANEVVYELYSPYSKRRTDQSAIKCIGVIEYFGVGGILKGQMAANAKRAYSTEKLKAAGWYRPNQKHAMDAVSHLLYYMDQRQAKEKRQ